MPRVSSDKLVSIIIPALNEEEHIGKCLSSIRDMDMGKESYEVVLSDNGSTDRTVEIAESFKGSINLRILVNPGVNVSELRNIGVDNSAGEIVAFVDSDCTVHKDWLNNAVGYFSDPSVGAVGYGHETPPGCSWVENAWDKLKKKRKLGPTETLPSGNMIVRRSSFTSIGGFNPALTTNEDFDLCYRLRGIGLKIFADPGISVVHWGSPKDLTAFYRREVWHGKDVIRVFLGNVRELKNLKAVLFALYYVLSAMLFVAGVVISLVFKNHICLAISVLALLTPPFLLSLNALVKNRLPLRYFIQFYILYFVYGIARAVSSLNFDRRVA